MSRSNHWQSDGHWEWLDGQVGQYIYDTPSRWVHGLRSYYKRSMWWRSDTNDDGHRRKKRYHRRWLGWGNSHKGYKRQWNQEYRNYTKRELLRATAQDEFDNLGFAHFHKVTSLWDWL
jgi:hypothetical protein